MKLFTDEWQPTLIILLTIYLVT